VLAEPSSCAEDVLMILAEAAPPGPLWRPVRCAAPAGPRSRPVRLRGWPRSAPAHRLWRIAALASVDVATCTADV